MDLQGKTSPQITREGNIEIVEEILHDLHQKTGRGRTQKPRTKPLTLTEKQEIKELNNRTGK